MYGGHMISSYTNQHVYQQQIQVSFVWCVCGVCVAWQCMSVALAPPPQLVRQRWSVEPCLSIPGEILFTGFQNSGENISRNKHEMHYCACCPDGTEYLVSTNDRDIHADNPVRVCACTAASSFSLDAAFSPGPQRNPVQTNAENISQNKRRLHAIFLLTCTDKNMCSPRMTGLFTWISPH